ncbi:hypothetical protein [Desertivirga arenae]|uniref:hypothetical protein n=1 Tax=Desertivirga arenae TaxID=2810309 RepID=UPI001A957DE7|nr:hypothetical protein [Pedobacter sp. SYSU D00823]
MKLKYSLLIIFLITSKIASSCKCMALGKIDDKQYDQYELIVKGRIIKVGIEGTKRSISVKVLNCFKGSEKADTVFISTPIDGAACGISPKVGEKWLLFANGSAENYTTSMCTRSKSMSSNAENFNKKEVRSDLKYLKRKN